MNKNIKHSDVVNDFKPPTKDSDYGQELIMDLHNCDVSKFNRKDLEDYCIKICDLTNMVRSDLHFWDYEGAEEEYKRDEKENPHLCGTSLCQFITTSNIVIHSIDPFAKCFVNFFSCRPFNPEEVMKLTVEFFKCEVNSHHNIVRH